MDFAVSFSILHAHLNKNVNEPVIEPEIVYGLRSRFFYFVI